MSIPIVDISPWTQQTDDVGRLHDSARQLGRAFEDTGFAVVVGHGVPTQTIEAVREQMVRLFDGPQKVKDAVRAEPVHGAQGYHEPGHENVAQLLGDFRKPKDRVQRFNINNLHRRLEHSDAALPAVADGLVGNAQGESRFPDVPGFQAALEEYYRCITQLWSALVGASEVALNLPTGYMTPFYGFARSTTFQLADYIKSEDAQVSAGEADVVFGAHTDSGGLTLISTNASGLQVQLEDAEWHEVPVLPGAFVVNVGRLLARWTNDRWLAAVHRVVSSPTGARKLTMAHFTSPRGDAMIQALPSCVAAGESPKYAPIMAADFLHQRHLLHIPPEQRAPEDKDIAKEFWEAMSPKRSQRIGVSKL